MKAKGILYTIISAIIFGFTPALASITYGFGNNALSMTFYRNLFVIPVLLLIIKYKKIPLKVEKEELKSIAIISFLGVALTTALLYSSYSYIGVGVATTLHFTYPIFVALACKFIFKEKLGRGKIFSLILAFVGVSFFMDIKSGGNILGAVLALVSGITYAFYIVSIDKKNLVKINPYKLALYMSSFAALELLVANIFGGYIRVDLPLKAYGLMIIISLLASIVGVVLFQIGVSIIGSTSAAIFSLFEPITSVVAGVLLFNEVLTPLKIIGCLVIFISITYLAISSKKESSELDSSIIKEVA